MRRDGLFSQKCTVKLLRAVYENGQAQYAPLVLDEFCLKRRWKNSFIRSEERAYEPTKHRTRILPIPRNFSVCSKRHKLNENRGEVEVEDGVTEMYVYFFLP